MKKLFLLCFAALFLAACGSDEVVKEDPKEKTEQVKEKKSSEKKEESKKKDAPKKEEAKINTSVFAYAKKVEVTDARDITQHITVFVHMSEKVTPGLATQHVFNQTYNFIQQADLDGAKTVTIAVKQGDIKIAQITVNKEDFTPNDTEPMIKLVLAASTIDSMVPEVKEFGVATGNW
ncbi:hypothetical protein [Bacillus marasmi]|uniref:hypothetical protein n=1 Tax=Bacillus marasmi TaxID=1926279 RepID=UPI0011C9261F|nr:hypothetical protein [Bacillus marasmi]